MGLLAMLDSRLRAEQQFGPVEQADGTWRTVEGWSLNPTTSAGVRVDAKSAETLSAVYACVRNISEDVASLPIGIFQQQPDGNRQLLRNSPLYYLLHHRPNSWQTPFEFKQMLTRHAVLRGGGYARIIPGPSGPMDQLIPLHPGRVTPERTGEEWQSGSMVYHYVTKRGERKTFLQEEIFHLRGMTDDGVVGLFPADVQRETFGTALATERYGASLFGNGAQLGGILKKKAAGPLTPTARENLYAGLRKFTGSRNAFKTMVLEEDYEWIQVGMRARDAEFLMSRKFSVLEVARAFRMPPHKIQSMDQAATYASVEAQGIEYVTDTIRRWAIGWEQAIWRDLLQDVRQFARLNVTALMRGDTPSRFAAYATAIQNGFMTRNEVRDLEDMNRIEGLDTPLRPLNMGDGTQPPADDQQASMEEILVH